MNQGGVTMLLLKNSFLKYLFLFLVGGFIYVSIELLVNGHSHISMLIAGGVCFILIGYINSIFPSNVSILIQMFISALVITFVELTTGIIVNVWLQVNVWDYSTFHYNLWGQICPFFTSIWFFLSLPAILFDDWLRYHILG
jgi:uncharacterized membrane protein